MNSSSPKYRIPSAARSLPTLAAVAVLGAVLVAGVAGGFGLNGGGGGDDDEQAVDSTVPSTTLAPTSSVAPVIVTEATEAPVTTTALSQPLGPGSAGGSVQRLQERLDELGFFVGPIDASFGPLTEKAVWAYKKLVMNIARDEVDGIVTNEVWQHMQQPISIEPLRKHSEGEATRSHTEIYLPSQIVIWFVDDEPVLISHMSSGTGQEWREEVTIGVGEIGNENGTEPLVRGEIGVSHTPGGVFQYERFKEGLRESALGGMWNPGYFNYGIAIHGALNVPLEPASHGCIRVPQAVGEVFHEFADVGDQVFVWDGVKEPEAYNQNPNAAYPKGPLPVFNRIDPDYSTTTTTSSTIAPSSTTASTQLQPTTSPPTVPQTQAPTTVATAPETTTTTMLDTSTTVDPVAAPG